MASVFDWLRNLSTKKSSSSTLVPYQNNPQGWAAADQNGYYTQNKSIVPFRNDEAGVTAAFNTPNYEAAAYNQAIQNGYIKPDGGSGGSYDPAAAQRAQEAAQKNSYISDIQSKFNTLQNIFNGLFGKADQIANERTNELTTNYDQQQNDLLKQYGQTADRTNLGYAARGLGSSTYLTNAQDENSNIYNRELGNIGTARNNNLASIGQTLASQKAGIQNQLDSYRNAYNQIGQLDLGGLAQAQNTFTQGINNANQTAATFGTNSDFISKLNGITPYQQQGTAQLAAKLKNLVTSSAPASAKKYVALGLIKASTLNDPNAQNYWQTEFERMLSGGA